MEHQTKLIARYQMKMLKLVSGDTRWSKPLLVSIRNVLTSKLKAIRSTGKENAKN
jgi:hypothetical protein